MRNSRLALGAVIAAGVASAGGGAVAQSELEAAIADLAARDVVISYDSLDGDSNGATATGLSITFGAAQARLRAVDETVSMRLLDDGVVEIDAPTEAQLVSVRLDGSDGPRPIELQTLDGVIGLQADGATLNATLAASEMTLVFGGGEYVQVAVGVEAGVSFTSDADAGVFDLDGVLGYATLTAGPATDGVPSLGADEGGVVSGFELTIDADLAGAALLVSADRAEFFGGDDPSAPSGEIAGLSLEYRAEPVEPLSYASIFGEGGGGAPAALAQTVFGGGAIALDVAVAALNLSGEAPMGIGMATAQGGQFTLSGEGYRLSGEISPQRIGLELAADLFDLEMASGADQEAIAAEEILIALFANPDADGFDLSPLAVAPPGQQSGLIAMQILAGEIMGGGDLRLITQSAAGSSSGAFTSIQPGFEFDAVFGPQVFELAIEQTRAFIATTAETASYDLRIGEDGGAASLDRFAFSAEFPITGSQDPQDAPISLELGGVSIDDSLWDAVIDPNGAITDRSIDGLSVAIRVETLVAGDLLAGFPLSIMAAPAFIQPQTAFLEELSLRAIGLSVDGSGSVSVGGPTMGAGAFDLSIAGWPGARDGLLALPFVVADPTVESTIRQIDGFLSIYSGAPDADPIELQLEGSGPGAWTINGQPAPF